KRIVANCGNHAQVWDAETIRPLLRLPGSSGVTAFYADGSRILGCDEHTLRVWAAETGQIIRSIPLAGGGRHDYAIFSPDGRWLAQGRFLGLGPAGARVRVWDTATGGLTAVVRG